MLTVIYLAIDGTAKVEHLNPKWRFVQLPDGRHPLTRESIFRDRGQNRATMFVLQGNSHALQHTPKVPPLITSIAKENEAYRNYMMKPLPTSKRFGRALMAAIAWIFRGVYSIATISILLFFLYAVIKVVLA